MTVGSPLSIGVLSRRRLMLSVLLHALMEPTELLKGYLVLLPIREFVNT